jgi:hypothetical protein
MVAPPPLLAMPECHMPWKFEKPSAATDEFLGIQFAALSPD